MKSGIFPDNLLSVILLKWITETIVSRRSSKFKDRPSTWSFQKQEIMNINSVVLYVIVYRLVQPEFVLLYVISRSSIMQSIKFLVIKLVWQIHQITRICLHAYMSDKLINFASAGGNSPLNGFDDKMLKNIIIMSMQ